MQSFIAVNIVTNMTIARQQLNTHLPANTQEWELCSHTTARYYVAQQFWQQIMFSMQSAPNAQF
jgi:hypothetical protein